MAITKKSKNEKSHEIKANYMEFVVLGFFFWFLILYLKDSSGDAAEANVFSF